VLDAEMLEKIEKFGRYLDVDGDGIPYRTYPGTHPTKGSYFTRGTSRNEYAVYTENGEVYKRNMDRLSRKWETSKQLVPAPVLYQPENLSEIGMIFFGTSQYSCEEALDILKLEGLTIDAIRIRAFPFNREIETFIASHKLIFVVEQNRDAQLKSLLIIELGADPGKFHSVLNYNGLPVTASFITSSVNNALNTVVS
jgi:2-oxoglutarate ferredoxin oxidoreductase subunit alpha